MRAGDITKAILSERWQRDISLPRYAPPHWWECDVLSLTKAGYAHEWEIKISRADFLVDAKKSRMLKDTDGFYKEMCKHDLLAFRSTLCPNRFSYVVPEGLVEKVEIPEWAGLTVAYVQRKRVYLREVKGAPMLHKKVHLWRDQMVNAGYYRFHRVCKVFDDGMVENGEGI